MKGLTFTLRAPHEQRLDLSALTPEALAGKSSAEIEAIDISRTKAPARVGDIFRLSAGDVARIVFVGGSARFDRVGAGMASGEIIVEGAVGVEAARKMSGGTLAIQGAAGPFAGSGMSGGCATIEGDAGERLGGPLAGEVAGMSGGVLHVRGSAGFRAGDRLRRGLVLIEGGAGDYLASRMIAGTIVVGGTAGDLPGYLMDRGTLVLGAGAKCIAPTFGDCGAHDFVAARLLARYVESFSPTLAAHFHAPQRRLAGDLAALGKGEIWTPMN